LGETGATVYCTGRSITGQPSPYARPETIDETADLIKSAGGAAIPVRVDHTVEAEVRALFERIDRDHGRLDVLVNSIAGEDPMMHQWGSFWKADLKNADGIFRQAIVSHIITAKHAAPLLIRGRRGLIVEATELKPHGVAAIAITPGFLRSESMLQHLGVTEANWRDAGKKDPNFLESESPLFVGRAVAALAQDPKILARTGQLLSSWEMSRE